MSPRRRLFAIEVIAFDDEASGVRGDAACVEPGNHFRAFDCCKTE